MLPVRRSFTNTSSLPFVSPGARLVAALENAMRRPVSLMSGSCDGASAWAPSAATLTRASAPDARTKMSSTPLVSPWTRFVAPEMNAICRPSPLSAG